LAGCAEPVKQSAFEGGGDVSPAVSTNAGSASVTPSSSVEGIDAKEAPKKVFQLDIYQVAVPRGQLSRNENVWKAVDEEVISPATRDLLDKNGILIGTAPLSELKNLQEELADPELSRKSLVGQKATRVEIELQTGIPSQTLFWFDGSGNLIGRTYDTCDNFLALSFRQTMRAPDKVSLQIAPLVRSQRSQILVTGSGTEREVDYVKPESIFELGISLELPLDRFLIIAPSAQSRLSTSVGRLFFTRDDPAQQMECAIVIVPQTLRMVEQKPH